MKEITLKCYKCKKDYPIKELKYAAIDKMICKGCSGQGKTESLVKPILRKEGSISMSASKQASSIENEAMIEYKCVNCNYAFKRKASVGAKICPYCGKEGTAKKKESLNKIMQESEDDKYGF